MLYETSVNLNLYELNILLDLLDEKASGNENNGTQDIERKALRAIYRKFEDHIYDMNFTENDNVEKILEEQKNLYKNDERG